MTNNTLAEGLEVGIGLGQIANANQDSATSQDDTDEHRTAYVTYTMSGVTVGYQRSDVEDNTETNVDERADGWGVAINLMDGLSVSYGEREIDFDNAANVTEDQEGFAVAYTMGSAKVSFQNNEVSNNGGTAGTSDENTEINLALSF